MKGCAKTSTFGLFAMFTIRIFLQQRKEKIVLKYYLRISMNNETCYLQYIFNKHYFKNAWK